MLNTLTTETHTAYTVIHAQAKRNIFIFYLINGCKLVINPHLVSLALCVYVRALERAHNCASTVYRFALVHIEMIFHKICTTNCKQSPPLTWNFDSHNRNVHIFLTWTTLRSLYPISKCTVCVCVCACVLDAAFGPYSAVHFHRPDKL